MEKFKLYDKNILDELYEQPNIELECLTLDDLLKLPVNEEYKKYNEGKEPPKYKGLGDVLTENPNGIIAEPIKIEELPTYYEKKCQPIINEKLTITFDENKYLNHDNAKVK